MPEVPDILRSPHKAYLVIYLWALNSRLYRKSSQDWRPKSPCAFRFVNRGIKLIRANLLRGILNTWWSAGFCTQQCFTGWRIVISPIIP